MRRATAPYTDFIYFPEKAENEAVEQEMVTAGKAKPTGLECVFTAQNHRLDLELGLGRAVALW